MKKVTYFGLLLAVALTGLSSCSSSDDVTSDPTNTKSGESRLTLTISTPVAKTSSAKGNSFVMGSRATDITTAPTEANEQQINHITVGIFSSDGKTVRTIQELSSGTGIGKYTQESNSATATATIVTNSLVAGDLILVACNAPAGTFQGVQNATAFKAETESIDNSLAATFGQQSGDALVDNNIPMFGSSTLEADGDNFKAGINVQHQTAKVTLSSLSVDFDPNGAYKEASFTPTAIFLINVPNELNFSSDATTGSTTLMQGYDASSTSTYKKYLSTSTFTGGTPLSGKSTFGSPYYFYTMPNSLTEQAQRTKLVIAGTFKSNSSDTGTPVYYPVPLNVTYDATGNATVPTNGGANLYAVYPNKNYKCTVTIKTKGAAAPNEDITPRQAAITVTVSPFTNVDQTTIFN